jgi:hypothetical protein
MTSRSGKKKTTVVTVNSAVKLEPRLVCCDGVYRTKTLLKLFVAALTAVIQMAAPLFYVAMVVNSL